MENKSTTNFITENNIWKSIFLNSLDAVGVSKAGIHVLVNPAYAQMFGFQSDEELKGTSILDIIAESEQEKIREYVRKRSIGERVPNTYHTLGKKQNGITFDLEVYVVAYQDNEDIYTLVTLRDISEKLKLEQELLKAKEKAEESDRLKSAFLANMAHEIRTPMNSIVGLSQLLTDNSLEAKQRMQFVELISLSADKLLNLVNDLIEISTIESHQMAISLTEVNISNLLSEIVDLYSNTVKNRNNNFISLGKIFNGNKCVVKTDGAKIKQIIGNLVNNALKFTKQGRIEIGCELIMQANTLDKRDLRFYVKDTGIGIDKNQLKLIFELFRQADFSTTRELGGVGLGLSISKSYVELLGGNIWVESELGKGSTFYFTIPYNVTFSFLHTDRMQTNETKYNWFDKTILIAEDEDYNFIFLKELLSKTFVNIEYACNGREAVEACRKKPIISLVLMDIKMPVLDGYEATKQIKEFRTDLPIIAQTAYAMHGDKEKALNAGCNEYLTKPIQKNQLIRLIAKYLEN